MDGRLVRRIGSAERIERKLAEERKAAGELFMLTKLVKSCVDKNTLPD